MRAYLTHDMALPTRAVKTSKIKCFMIHWNVKRRVERFNVFSGPRVSFNYDPKKLHVPHLNIIFLYTREFSGLNYLWWQLIFRKISSVPLTHNLFTS